MRRVILTAFILNLAAAFASAGETPATARIQNMDLRNCFQQKCIQMRAAHAESGTLTPLMSLKNVQIDFFADGKKSSYSSSYGYIDFERNVVSIRVKPRLEMLFNLNDMSLYKFNL
jgi:hypothetical protein